MEPESEAKIDYAIGRRSERRRSPATMVLIPFVVAGSCAIGVWALWHYFEYGDLDRTRAYLYSLPNVSITNIDGYDDSGFNVVYAAITITTKPSSCLSFQWPVLLCEGKHIRLSQIGPYHLWVSGHGYGWAVDKNGAPAATQFYQDWFDIGPEGYFPNLGGVTIRSGRDVVENYDQLLAARGFSPQFPTYPLESFDPSR